MNSRERILTNYSLFATSLIIFLPVKSLFYHYRIEFYLYIPSIILYNYNKSEIQISRSFS